MKKLIILLAFSAGINAQQVKVGSKVSFAGLTVNLDQNAQKIVQNEVNTLLMPSKFLDQKIERMQMYLPLVEEILVEEEVPTDFKYVPVAESNLISDAVSSSNAVGFWQFKNVTATEMGLRVDAEVDERQNIFAATHAAAVYLKRNNVLYKNWISSLFAYYLGATGVSKLIPAAWQYADEITLDSRTDRYIFKALAHRLAFEDRINRLREGKYTLIEYKKGRGANLSKIAADLDIPEADLVANNTWLKTKNIPNDKEYSLAVVVANDKADELMTDLKKVEKPDFLKEDLGFPILKRISLSNQDPTEPVKYEINHKKGVMAQSGNTFEQLAAFGKVKMADFMKYNDLSTTDLPLVGMVYYLQKKDKKAKVPFHTVGVDQTIRDISHQYGVRLANILKYNRMETVQRVQPGRILWLRKKRPESQQVEYVTDFEKMPKKPVIVQENEPLAEVKEKATWVEVDINQKEQPSTKPYVPAKQSTNTYTPEGFKPETKKTEEPKVNVPSYEIVREKPTATEVQKTNKPSYEIIREIPLETVKEETKTNKPSYEVVRDKPTVIEEPKVSKPSYEIIREKPLETVKEETKANKPSYEVVRDKPTVIDEPKANKPSYEIIREKPLETVKEETKTNKPSLEAVLDNSEEVVYKKSTKEKETNLNANDRGTNFKSGGGLIIHKVDIGNTVFSLAKRYAVSVEDIRNWNNLGPDTKLYIGQELIVSQPGSVKTTNATASERAFHTVAAGENLYRISIKYNTTIDYLKRLNNLADENIKLGQRIRIK